MVPGIGGVGTVVAHDEHMSLRDLHTERETAGRDALTDVRGFVDGHAVDGHGAALARAFDHVAGQSDQSFDEPVLAENAVALLVAQPVGRILEHHDVAAAQIHGLGCQGQGQHAVAGHDGVLHRSAGDGVHAEYEHAQQQDDQYRYAAPDQGVAQAHARGLTRRRLMTGHGGGIHAVVGHDHGAQVPFVIGIGRCLHPRVLLASVVPPDGGAAFHHSDWSYETTRRPCGAPGCIRVYVVGVRLRPWWPCCRGARRYERPCRAERAGSTASHDARGRDGPA